MSTEADVAASIVATLRDHMAALGLTQVELATRAGMAPTLISDILRGRYRLISLRSLVRLGEAIGCDVVVEFRPPQVIRSAP